MVKQRLHQIIFGNDSPASRTFDLALMVLILLSLVVVVLDSMEPIATRHATALDVAEWTFTLVFTAEYLARLYCAPQRWRYATSFFGLIDLLSVLPSYLALLVPDLQALIDIRVLRLLRVFRVLKLTQYLVEVRFLMRAIASSRRKILVFLFTAAVVVLIMGTVMYVVEGPRNGFTSIPVAVYWAITTMTTVGFGDITPKTDLGRAITSLMMLMGWGVLAVPTGIVTAEMVTHRTGSGSAGNAVCPQCGGDGLDDRDRFCRHCGTALPPAQELS